jgi:uncharacterized protein YukE
MNPLGDPGQIRALASRFERGADALARAGASWQSRLDSAAWSCAKADRYRHQVATHRHEADRRAAALRGIAIELRRHAEWVQNTTNEIMALERRIRSWFGVDQSIPLELPGRGDPAWLDVPNQLRRLGIHF